MFQLLEEEKPDYIVAAFDSKGKNFRHELYDQYKANRSVMPDEIQLQLPYLWELLDGMNIPVLRKEGVEADDIIGTIAKMCEKDDLQCNIVSGDKDFMQLINDKLYYMHLKLEEKKKKSLIKIRLLKNGALGQNILLIYLG